MSESKKCPVCDSEMDIYGCLGFDVHDRMASIKNAQQLAALTADKERLQRQLDAAKAGLEHYAEPAHWGESGEESPFKDWYKDGTGYDLAASTLEAIEQENK